MLVHELPERCWLHQGFLAEFIFMAALHLMPLLTGAEQPIVDDMVAAII